MKIIKKGEIPKKKKIVYQFECTKCKTVYQADTTEVSFIAVKRLGFYMELYSEKIMVCKCPVCLTENDNGKKMEVEEDG